MKLLSREFVGRLIPCRNYVPKGKPRKYKRPDYVPWALNEIIEDIDEVLSKPYKQFTPTSTVLRTPESNPSMHTNADISKVYILPDSIRQQYFTLGGISNQFGILSDTFNECGIIIRKPAIEIINYLKQANYSKLPVKYVIYGPKEAGKEITLLHVMHYAVLNDFILIHLPNAKALICNHGKDANPSETRNGLVDTPLEGAYILKRFEFQNKVLVNKLQLTTTKEYIWNARESLPVGSPLMALVNHGINRIKYSCDVLDALIQELKLAATYSKCKVLVSIDGVNALNPSITYVKVEGECVSTDNLSIYTSFKSLFNSDWCNGAIVATVCEKFLKPEQRNSSMPFDLLKRPGFENLDPFIPIEVGELTELEFHNLLNYYEDRRWLQKSDGREEIEFLTTRLPGEVIMLCNRL